MREGVKAPLFSNRRDPLYLQYDEFLSYISQFIWKTSLSKQGTLKFE